MYTVLRSLILSVLAAPDGPPDPPPGSEETTEVFRASNKYLYYKMAGRLLANLFGIVLLASPLIGAVESQSALEASVVYPIALVGAGLWLLVPYLLVRVDYDMRYYVVTDRSLRIREGAWNINESTFTFANVQNLSIKQGPIDSLLGISNLVVHTAGGGEGGMFNTDDETSTGGQNNVLRGIDDAKRIRDKIQRRVKKYHDAGLGDDTPDAQRLPHSATESHSTDIPIDVLRDIRDEISRLGRLL